MDKVIFPKSPTACVRIENSFIPVHGIGEVTERKLWQAGITTWREFDGSVVGPARADRIRSFIDQAQHHLDQALPGYFADSVPTGSQWRLFENFRHQTCYLDIETTGLSPYRDRTTVVSLHQNDDTTTLVRGRTLSARRLQKELADASLLVSFNGKQFDLPFLAREFDLDISIPHVDLRYAARRVGLTGGLSEIERSLNIQRSHPEVGGEEAVRLWHEYQAGNPAALDTLVEYNRADTRNLAPIMDEVTGRLHEQVFESVLETP